MQLGQKPFTIGDTKFITVNYDSYLCCGNIIVSATATSSQLLAVVSSITVLDDKRSFKFKLDGSALTNGNVNETFTVTVQITDNEGAVTNDTLTFIIVTP